MQILSLREVANNSLRQAGELENQLRREIEKLAADLKMDPNQDEFDLSKLQFRNKV